MGAMDMDMDMGPGPPNPRVPMFMPVFSENTAEVTLECNNIELVYST